MESKKEARKKTYVPPGNGFDQPGKEKEKGDASGVKLSRVEEKILKK